MSNKLRCSEKSKENKSPLLLLGTGQVGKEVIRQELDTRRITATTRSASRLQELLTLRVEPLVMPTVSVHEISQVAYGSDVLVSFPPDGITDALLAPACADARAIVYISSTAVYGKKTGTIDDTTEPDRSDERALLRLAAEEIWRAQGAIILRAPGIYGPDSGLHKRLLAGQYKLPDGGQNMVSRIHIEDLARIILSVFKIGGLKQQTYVIGDEHPCKQVEIVSWLCHALKIPLPESVPLVDVSPTLRGNRAVDGRRILSELGISLKYPSYEIGYGACISEQI